MADRELQPGCFYSCTTSPTLHNPARSLYFSLYLSLSLFRRWFAEAMQRRWKPWSSCASAVLVLVGVVLSATKQVSPVAPSSSPLSFLPGTTQSSLFCCSAT